ncbi:MAG: hypothetical protein CTY35_00425 [Methylotenera sp.]|uniref:hypothetical protein n=1 Tax=Methylotenera sp. TaxID=2051956 RepID=UPI000D3F113B|nr:hypothetical protein [Methylotenera sp.]PPC84820.1 MAG: hypothetical protein CTY38_00420 [Methylotenera sp.]PPD02180.1 MAG: hypothetical protein CTY35_00425 [Methylotenera sp.]
MKTIQFILVVCWLAVAHQGYAGEQQYAFLTSKGSYLVAKIDSTSLKSASTSVGRMDYFITQQYLSPYSIAKEKNGHLKQWMTLVSQLALTGNVIAAQLLVNEIKVKQEDKTALPILKRIINESTLAVEDDTLFMQSQAYIDAAQLSFKQWPTIERECANVMVTASAYGDEIAYRYAQQCLSGYQQKNIAIQAGKKVKSAIETLKKGAK